MSARAEWKNILGFKETKRFAVQCLQHGEFKHKADRGRADEKNLLLSGEISVNEVIQIINRTKGGEYREEKNHDSREPNVHIFNPTGWYIKFIIISGIVFISVHPD